MLTAILAILAIVLIVAGVLGLLGVIAVPWVACLVVGGILAVAAWLLSGRGPRDIV